METILARRTPTAVHPGWYRLLLAAILGSSCILHAAPANCETKSKLTKVVAEAKKPVEEQEVVLREHHADDDDDDGLGIFDVAAIFLTAASSSSESNLTSSPSTSTATGNVHFSLSSLFLQPADTVLSSLRGGGFALRGSSGKMDLEIGAYFLRGEIHAESVLHEGIVAPFELTLAGRVRTHLERNRLFGLNAFIGGQYGRLFWDYHTSVFAIDEFGYGQELGRDSIGNISGFIGIGITPIHTRSIDLDINVRTGMRVYYTETSEGFSNDAFRSNAFTGVDIELVFHL